MIRNYDKVHYYLKQSVGKLTLYINKLSTLRTTANEGLRQCLPLFV